MSDNTIRNYDELHEEIYQLYEQQAFTQATDLLNREAPRFPERDALALYWRMCLSCLTGQTDLAMQTLSGAIDRGYWYSESWLRGDPDLEPLRSRSEFESLVAVSIQRANDLASRTAPSRINLPPTENTAAPYPLLIALHGNNSIARFSVDYWRSAAQHGWYLSLPMSTQLSASDAAVWDDDEQTTREVQQHHHEIMDHQPIDPNRIVIGGFSVGAKQAIRLGLTGAIPTAGIIAIGPSFGEDVNRLLPHLESAKQRNIRVYMIVGGRENPQRTIDPAKHLSELFDQHEIPCQLKIYPDMGHAFPPDFTDILPEILSWLTA